MRGYPEYWKKILKNIEIVKAFAEGKDVQFFDHDAKEWLTRKHYDFDGEIERYRIKPEPQEVWIVTHQYRSHRLAFTSKIEADKYKILANVPGRSVRYVAVDDV